LKNLSAVGNSGGDGRGFTQNTNPASLTCVGTCSASDLGALNIPDQQLVMG
jgi:hypothetical protein